MNKKIDKLKKSKHKKNFFHNQQQKKKNKIKVMRNETINNLENKTKKRK